MLSADSVAFFAGIGRFDMIGQKSPVHIRDTAITLDAQRASYFLRLERLDAHVNVVAVNRRTRSEEHTSELQSQSNLVCRLLLEKKKKKRTDDESVEITAVERQTCDLLITQR